MLFTTDYETQDTHHNQKSRKKSGMQLISGLRWVQVRLLRLILTLRQTKHRLFQPFAVKWTLKQETLIPLAPYQILHRTHLCLGGVLCNSMEGFLQSLKFKNPEMQKYVCTLVGRKAKMIGRNKNWYTTQTLWWDGKPIKRDSEEYQELLDEAYVCMFTQNEKARKALLASQDAVLTHSIGKRKINETVLTKREFCSRLMEIRKELQIKDML